MRNRTLLLCLVILFVSSGKMIANEADRVVVLANANVPESIEIARHYIARRSIPEENLILLPFPAEETVSVRDYVDQIYNPLLTALKDKGWVQGARSHRPDFIGRFRMSIGMHRISYLVTTYGVPLRIKNDPELLEPRTSELAQILQVNRGSVDSELAVLAIPEPLPLVSMVKNPYYEKKVVSAEDAGGYIRVSRLDGPSFGAVKRLIDRTIEAERNGLRGRAYFDIGGPHKQGDEWFSEAVDLAQSVYFDTDIESSRRTIDHRDRLDAPAIYMGWYRHKADGPFGENDWAVPPGALGFHLHSFSATTVRSSGTAWVGPLVAQGYCMTIGNVFEPYLEFTHRPQLLLERLLSGGTFGEAAAYSYPVASWMGIALGDPLFRPFAVSFEEQLKAGSEDSLASYVALREINRLKKEEGLEAAVESARMSFLTTPSLPLAYKLAVLYASDDQPEKAVEALKFIRFLQFFPKEDRILVKKIADLLDQNGESRLAFAVYEKLLAADGLPKKLKILLLTDGSKVAIGAGETMTSARWSSKAVQLKQPPQK